MSKLFGNFYKAVATDNSRPAMESAYIINGFIYATDAHILVKVPASNWISEESLAKAEGKAIHRLVLKEMAKSTTKKIEFTDLGVKIMDGLTKILPYSAIYNPDGDNWFEVNAEGNTTNLTFSPPVWDRVIPDTWGGTTDFFKINPVFLVNIQECLFGCVQDGIGIRADFSAKDPNTKAIKISAAYKNAYLDHSKDEAEFGIIMPLKTADVAK